MTFDCYAKYGNHWSYKGTIQRETSQQAAFAMQHICRRNIWRICPEGSNIGYTYRISSDGRSVTNL